MTSPEETFKNLVLGTRSFCFAIKANTDKSASTEELMKVVKRFDDSCRSSLLVNDHLSLFKLEVLANLSVALGVVKRNDDKAAIINCMTNVLWTSTLDNVEFFIRLYNTVFYQIYSDSESDQHWEQCKSSKLPEELMLSVLKCASELIKRSNDRLFTCLYSEEYVAQFSMGVLISVRIAAEEKSKQLRIAALDFLLYAMQYHKKRSKSHLGEVGNLFMFYLPGVIKRLEQIVSRDETQSHQITLKAISCWGQLLCTVMQDKDEDSMLSDREKMQMWTKLGKDVKVEEFDVRSALKETTRTKNWLQAAAQILIPHIRKIRQVQHHSHPSVRLELVTQVSRLLENCAETLKSSLSPLIEILIASCEDEDDDVREEAEFAVVRFEHRCNTEKTGRLFVNVIEENLDSVMIKLPNLIHLGNDQSILSGLQVMRGNLKILQESGNLARVINLSTNLTRLVRVLVMALRLELYPELTMCDYSVWDNEVNSTLWTKQWKRFTYFAHEAIRKKLVEIGALIGKTTEINETVLDYLLDRFREDLSCRNEILLIVNDIVAGCSGIPENLARQLLDLYLDPDNLYLTLEVNDDDCETLHQARSNVVTVALIMEGLGILASAMGFNFNDHLLRSLYFVVERMGSSYTVIRTSAVTTAHRIATAVGLVGDTAKLIETNVDYLTYHITVKLRRSHPGVFDVITVLMKNSPFEAMTNLEEIIRNVLKSSTESFNSPLTISYLRLFQTFVLCVNKWIVPPKSMEPLQPIEKTELDLFVEDITKEKNMDDDETINDEAENGSDFGKEEDDAEDEGAVATEDKPKPPKYIELTLAIAEATLNHLPSNDFGRKLIALEILNESVWILANRENDLLPLVHKIWSPLGTSFDRLKDPLLISRSFTLLVSLSRTSKDFIRRRTLKNVLPSLREFLLKSSDKSKLKDTGSSYHMSQQFKLQKELLDKLSILAVDLNLTGRELDLVIESTLPYLSCVQPQLLQEKCRKFFHDFKRYDPYVAWYKVHPLKNDEKCYRNVKLILDDILSPA